VVDYRDYMGLVDYRDYMGLSPPTSYIHRYIHLGSKPQTHVNDSLSTILTLLISDLIQILKRYQKIDWSLQKNGVPVNNKVSTYLIKYLKFLIQRHN
jgi:type II secretory pathway component PulC